MNILTLNAGSATLKYKLYSMPSENVLAEGTLDNPGVEGIEQAAVDAIEKCRANGIDAIGHRVVHGGSKFTQPVAIAPDVLANLNSLRELDPLHNPVELAMIRSGLKILPNTPAIAVFDTAFHQTLPEIAWRYTLPREETQRFHLRRYGFHGLSYQYVSERLLRCLNIDPPGSRLIVCHLGSGASVCALKDGKSVDTSMGMTPLEGLAMGTRSGDVDPGLLLYLQRAAQMKAEEVEEMLSKRSGVLGVSGISGDFRELESAALRGDKNAELALEIFAYRVSKYIGAYAAVLNGIDALAFTGGIGENSSDTRQRICRRLSFLGVTLDETLNATDKNVPRRIGDADSPVQVWVVPTNEELQIARNVQAMLTAS